MNKPLDKDLGKVIQQANIIYDMHCRFGTQTEEVKLQILELERVIGNAVQHRTYPQTGYGDIIQLCALIIALGDGYVPSSEKY